MGPTGDEVGETNVLVARLSESFSDVWRQLGAGLSTEVRMVPSTEARGISQATAAVLLAAGGAEREALEWLERHAVPAGTPVFVVGSDTGRRIAARVVSRGASDYFALPEDIEILRNAVASALARRRELISRAAGESTPSEVQAFRSIVGESPAIQAVLQRAGRLLRHAHGTALIVGETGTGKELLARAIHEGGPRRAAPFVPVNCSALPRHLIESELFGHERGAFTDAHAAKPGLFEVADGGTLFLDEIGTLPVDLQAKLLRVLEDREIRRVGANKSRRVDVRIIAATNQDLDEATRTGAFRQDLYFRLGVITLLLPPLRERGADVLPIARQLLASLAREHGVAQPELAPDAERALLSHSWPGNVRELKNAIERALLLSPPGHLDTAELLPARTSPLPQTTSALPFPARLDAITHAAARATLKLCGGNVSEAARRLKISRRRLRRLLHAVA
ncbi:MAG TPA: sigma-54 dependent transcriptional regulator [Gemmatimonadales bacterium]|jgi:two-component system response regulator HydG|nr:sigma-54 dependent transcriptional regulator [Gemmatimonadales bacterium]